MTDSVRLLAIAYGLPPAEMEATLRTMPAEFARALVADHDGTRRSQAAKADALGCSLAHYKSLLVCARSWLRGAASGRRATTTPHRHL